WLQAFTKHTGLNPYVWVILCILPFYFSFSSSTVQIVLGVFLILLFFISYGMSFLIKGWQVYLWTGMQIAISVAMTLMYGYVYFSLFLAFFIGNIRNRAGFFTLYTVLLVGTIVTI